MTQKNWHIERQGTRTTVARQLPARFDVSACAEFPLVSPTRLARQIRQDMWRTLQSVRGFSPVVQVEQSETGLSVTAGGRALHPVPANLAEKIDALLHDASRRARWIAWAQRAKP